MLVRTRGAPAGFSAGWFARGARRQDSGRAGSHEGRAGRILGGLVGTRGAPAGFWAGRRAHAESWQDSGRAGGHEGRAGRILGVLVGTRGALAGFSACWLARGARRQDSRRADWHEGRAGRILGVLVGTRGILAGFSACWLARGGVLVGTRRATGIGESAREGRRPNAMLGRRAWCQGGPRRDCTQACPSLLNEPLAAAAQVVTTPRGSPIAPERWSLYGRLDRRPCYHHAAADGRRSIPRTHEAEWEQVGAQP